MGALQDARVVACPPEGVIILSSLAMRAHQTFVLAQSAERLRDYVQVIGARLEGIGGEMAKLAKPLRGATKYAEESLRDIEGTKSALAGISTRLEVGTDGEAEIALVPAAPLYSDRSGRILWKKQNHSTDNIVNRAGYAPPAFPRPSPRRRRQDEAYAEAQ